MGRTIRTAFSHIAQDIHGNRWFLERIYKCVCCMEKENGKIHMIKQLGKDINEEQFMPFGTYIDNDLLYVTSQNSPDIVIYDMNLNFFSYYQSPQKNDEELYYNPVRIGRHILNIPQKIKYPIWIFDMDKMQFSERKWNSIEDENEIVSFVHQEEEMLYLPVLGKNYIFALNGKSFSAEIINLPENVGVNSLCINGEEMWITQSNSRNVIYKKGNVLRTLCLEKKEDSFSFPFSQIVCTNGKLVMLPRFESKLYLYDTVSGEVNKIPIIDTNSTEKRVSLLYGYYFEEDKIVFLPWGTPDFYEIGYNDLSVNKYELRVECLGLYEITGRVLLEAEEGVQELLEGLKKEKNVTEYRRVTESVGKNIHNKIVYS